MDPTRPLENVVQVESPHVVQYTLFARIAGETEFTPFASGTDMSAGEVHTVGPLPRGSEIGMLADVAGNPRTAWRVRLTVMQGGNPVPGAELVLRGTTDDNGADSAQGSVTVS